MNLFEEIASFSKRSKQDTAIFRLLLLYNNNESDKLCYDLILELTKKIDEQVVIYSKEKSTELYNIIDKERSVSALRGHWYLFRYLYKRNACEVNG